MASITGSVLTFSALGPANSGTVSTTITVPADATYVLVGWSGYSSSGTFYAINGALKFTKSGSQADMTYLGGGSSVGWSGPLYGLALPDTGTNKTLTWDFNGTNLADDANSLCSIVFLKDVDTASLRSFGDATSGSLPYTTGSLAGSTGDLAVGWVGAFASAEGAINSWSNLTLLSQLTHFNSADGAWATGSPTTAQTYAALTGSNIDDGALTVVIFKNASGGAAPPDGWQNGANNSYQSRPVWLSSAPAQVMRAIPAPAPAVILPWQRISEQPKPRQSFDYPPAYVVRPHGTHRHGWHVVEDAWRRPARKLFEAAPAQSLRPIVQPVPISGMAWATQPDRQPVKPRQIDWPVEPIQATVTITWSLVTSDTVFLRDPPRDAPAAFGRAIPASPVAISGMAWFAPPDRDRPVVKVRFEAPASVALTPATLPPQIAGMAWFEPLPDTTVARKSASIAPAFGQPIGQPPSTIAGMAWFAPRENDLGKRRVPIDAPSVVPFPTLAATWCFVVPDVYAGRRVTGDARPAFGGVPASPAPVGVSGMAWFVPLPVTGVARKIAAGAPATVFGSFTVPATPLITGWGAQADELVRRRRSLDGSSVGGNVAAGFSSSVSIGAWAIAPQDQPRRAAQSQAASSPPALTLIGQPRPISGPRNEPAILML